MNDMNDKTCTRCGGDHIDWMTPYWVCAQELERANALPACETCGEPAPTGMRYCLDCIDAHDRAIGAGAYQPVGAITTCPCGQDAEPGNAYCAACGYHLMAAANPIAWDVVNAQREQEFVEAFRDAPADETGTYIHITFR